MEYVGHLCPGGAVVNDRDMLLNTGDMRESGLGGAIGGELD